MSDFRTLRPTRIMPGYNLNLPERSTFYQGMDQAVARENAEQSNTRQNEQARRTEADWERERAIDDAYGEALDEIDAAMTPDVGSAPIYPEPSVSPLPDAAAAGNGASAMRGLTVAPAAPAPTPQRAPQEMPTPSSGPVVAGNIDLNNRPVVPNGNGYSTVRTIGVNIDGMEYNIPTVSDDGRLLSDDEAVALFRQTGKHLGAYRTQEEAAAAAEKLHNDQAQQYGGRAPATGGSSVRNLRAGTRGQAADQAMGMRDVIAKKLRNADPRAAANMRLGNIEGRARQQDQQDDAELKVLEMLEAGNVQQAQAMARQFGVDLPPEALQNGQVAHAMAETGRAAKAMGATDDGAWMQKFMSAYIQTGDSQRALQAAGQPTRAPKANLYDLTTITNPDGTTSIGSFNTGTGAITNTGVQGFAGKGASGEQSAQMKTMNGLMGMGYSRDQAAKMVFDAKSSSQGRAELVVRLMDAAMKAPAFNPNDPKAVEKVKQDAINTVKQINLEMSEDQAVAPGQAAPQAPGPAVAPTAPAAPSASPQAEYPPAPANPTDRRIGQKYTAPSGRVGEWTGSGWLPVEN